MPEFLSSSSDTETLDGAVIRQLQPSGRFGWRWRLSGGYLVLLMVFLITQIETGTSVVYYPPLSAVTSWSWTDFLLQWSLLLWVAAFLSFCFFVFKRQIGWVLAKILTSAIFVMLTLLVLYEFIPAGNPNALGSSINVPLYLVMVFLTGGALYLLIHPLLRGGFRIPNSWVWRCVTLGGFIGTAMGAYLVLTGN